jgi:hypothetical protein
MIAAHGCRLLEAGQASPLNVDAHANEREEAAYTEC